ncbi:DUF2142 domain-containing protein [Acidovorax sp. CCYZU-2555]|uniref:DUF2142 domain-containing protein n=1 Tax=Acidovorax sp. CCYZU-2555 TaxID=2835042 RepID=UPI001BCE004E|nr:DUF2142 domain-containing protein [Acidovorax sp. CCYZU-2555]MBS7777104.1 DUF2142 domain-containing protein [Acidovorax sp. CCYZU-2555]
MKILDSNFLLKYFIIILLAVGGSYFIPPMQSPDENQHFAKAYLVSHGDMLLTSPEGLMSGGHVDDGLRDFIQGHMQLSGRPEIKLTQEEKDRLKSLEWSDAKSRSFMQIPGTGFYLPLIYLPHALAIKLGEMAQLSIHHTYYLTRIFVMAISIALTLFAFSIHRPGILALGILMLPMSIFQLLSPTLDGLTTSLSLIAISLFLSFQSKTHRHGAFYLLAFLLVLIATTRIHLAPLLLLLFIIAFQQRNRKFLALSLLSSGFTLFWIVFSIKTTVDNRIPRDISSLETLEYYLIHPMNFMEVLFSTVTNKDMMDFYLQSFIGKLGWLDTSLPLWQYAAFSACLVLFVLLNIFATAQNNSIARSSLFGTALLSVLAIFTALLISWTPHPATIVHGIQGRYFIVPSLLLAYAFNGMIDVKSRTLSFANQLLLSVFFAFSAYALLSALQSRYSIY